ncbi:tRNA guanosine(34) transglycosylase Tgt [Patescibacteria group bacterium]|nr:tRNA guanosine(34) transglycosylase Tgt [Patescibacteria group bacterium]MBU4162128.1 tRNA guanosine(34) transglycosylase Tgt [Patescibacteria group bacterium]
MFKFEIQEKSKKSRARIGEIITPHGKIKTPAFIPVATLGVIKGGLSSGETQQTKAQCQITNTFHFLDLDRANEVEQIGGLHKFFNFDKPIFTDSGGFQVFSLGKGSEFGLGKIGSIFPQEKSAEIVSRQKENSALRKKGKNLLKISQRGARFKSPRDGREILLTPELSFKIQKQLGADFIYLLDVCGSPMDSRKEAEKEMEISHQWFKRFLKTASNSGVGGNKSNQQIFGIIQGGVFKDLREQSTKFVNDLPVFGIAIGGALGKSKKDMYKTISWVNEDIDWQRPHHLLGIGDLDVLEEIVKLGIDLFDCALPTRIARHGTAMTSKGYLNLDAGKLKNKFEPIDKNCECPVCQKYTIAQINFLFRAKEMLAGKLLTIHNLFFLETKLEGIRDKIKSKRI